ncbi:hypothetical protein RHSIM_Rhsim06G0105800 [Rhododendron simsii]|uniref:Uncharacterized protein n=1 Tax=Rhododendron simsii TaxID=118357 RepID=A0A834GST5_RHOSS|nr:hypothetical protein RHSIM_Rhsim06G0105800 [Rhododendron simsii]
MGRVAFKSSVVVQASNPKREEVNSSTEESGRAFTSQVITKESFLAAQRQDLHRVKDLLCLGEFHAWTLLIHYHWDVEKLFAVLVEKA